MNEVKLSELIIKPKKKSPVIAIILFMLAVFWFAGAIGWHFIYKPVSERNTAEYTATIKSIHPITPYRIITEEYNAKLGIFFEKTVIDMGALSSLSAGQSITFRIKNGDVSDLGNANAIIYVISLKTESASIITIESYNANSSKVRSQAVYGFVVGGVICLAIATLFLLRYKGKLVRKKSQ